MDRVNSEGVPRHLLLFALKDRSTVRGARRINSCLLCRARNVNEAGLCDVCYSLLNDQELRIACRWMSGEGP